MPKKIWRWENYPLSLKMSEAMEILRVSRSTLYKLIGDGTIRHHKVGREIRFDREELRRYIGGETP